MRVVSLVSAGGSVGSGAIVVTGEGAAVVGSVVGTVVGSVATVVVGASPGTDTAQDAGR